MHRAEFVRAASSSNSFSDSTAVPGTENRREAARPRNATQRRGTSMNIYCDSVMEDTKRREKLYGGSIFLYSPSPAARRLCAFARELLETAFAPHDPRTIQQYLPVE